MLRQLPPILARHVREQNFQIDMCSLVYLSSAKTRTDALAQAVQFVLPVSDIIYVRLPCHAHSPEERVVEKTAFLEKCDCRISL